MPVYDYRCREHGLFHQLATLTESAEPRACPTCGTLSARVIVLPPEVVNTDAGTRDAHERNERSQHAPLFSTPEQRKEAQAKAAHKHGKGCGCSSSQPKKSSLFYTADGKKMFPSMRPWMISH